MEWKKIFSFLIIKIIFSNFFFFTLQKDFVPPLMVSSGKCNFACPSSLSPQCLSKSNCWKISLAHWCWRPELFCAMAVFFVCFSLCSCETIGFSKKTYLDLKFHNLHNCKALLWDVLFWHLGWLPVMPVFQMRLENFHWSLNSGKRTVASGYFIQSKVWIYKVS